MPIRREWRALYRSPEWRETRARILARAGHRCENCGKPDRALVFTYTWQTWMLVASKGLVERRKLYHMVWLKDGSEEWRDQHCRILPKSRWPHPGLPRRIRVQLGVAHVDGDPTNRADSNLRAWCTWCHLNHDRQQHKQSRSERKDKVRGMLA